jgi:hypothetical protein
MAQHEMALSNGPACAAVLAAGIGSCALGVLVTLNEASAKISGMLNLYGPVGPLSGKTGVAILVWLVAWGVLASAWKDRDVDFGKVWRAALTLVILGLLGTFPLVFDLFG